MIQKRNRYKFIEVLIVIFLIIYMDVPFFSKDKIGRMIFLIFLFLSFAFRSRKNKFDSEIFVITSIVALVIGIQGFLWGFQLLTLFSYIGFIFLIPYFALRILGIKFLAIFSDIIWIIAGYSLLLWLAQNLIPSFDNAIQNFSVYMFQFGTDEWPRSIIFYTVPGYDGWANLPLLGIYRNCGAFHEPGAFAVFLDLAIAINIMRYGKIYNRKNNLMILALISTFSTAGIFALFVIFLIYYIEIIRKSNPVYSLIVFTFLTMLFYALTVNIPFLGDKVENTYIEETNRNLETKTSGRIFSARKAIVVLKRYPILGKGITSSVRENMTLEEDTGGYGFMSFFSQIGVFLSLAFIIYFMKGLKRISNYFSGTIAYWHILFFSLAINLFSQKFLVDSVFMMMFLIGALSRYSRLNLSSNQANVASMRKGLQ